MRKSVLIWGVLAIVALVALAVGFAIPATAQGDVQPKTATPQPSPTNNGGKATWTVKSRVFKSDYPKGFGFTIDASSSGGKIVEASVAWSYAPGYLKRARGKVDASGAFTAAWDGTGSDRLPAWIGVDYWWTLQDEAGNIFETPHILEDYADTAQKWKRAESEDVLVFWQEGVPDDIGQHTIDAMKLERSVYYRSWGRLLNYKPRVVVYANREYFATWNPDLSVTAAGRTFVAGRTSGEWGATVQVYTPRRLGGTDSLTAYTAYSTILHEIGHLYQYAARGGLSGDWFIEGNASYFERITLSDGKNEMPECVAQSKEIAATGKFPTLQGEGPSIRGAEALEGYYIGCAFFHWLEEKYGPEAHLKLWNMIGRGTRRDEALEQVTGLKFIEMETEFRKWIGVTNAIPPTQVEIPTLQFPPTRAPRTTRTP